MEVVNRIFSKYYQITAVILVGSGVFVLLGYCAKIDYYPRGISLGDGFIFIGVGLWVIVFSIITFGFLYSVARLFFIPIFYVFDKITIFIVKLHKFLFKNKNFEDRNFTIYGMYFSLMGLMPLGVFQAFENSIFFESLSETDKILFLYLMLGYLYALLDYVCFTSGSVEKIFFFKSDKIFQKAVMQLTAVFVLGIFTFFISLKFPWSLIDYSMDYIGVKHKKVSILCSDSEMKMIGRLVGYDAEVFEGELLFSGFGGESLMVINSKKITIPDSTCIIERF